MSDTVFQQSHRNAQCCMRFRESNIDDVLQISNIFVNVSKGEVAKANDLEKAFGESNTNDIVKEVR